MENGYRLFDSHAHYFDAKFDGREDEILRTEVFGKDVGRVINVGTNPVTNALCVAQAAKYDGMYAAVGIHPEDCQMMTESAADAVSELEKFIGTTETRKRSGIVALGEIGLDYHVNGGNPDRLRQMEFFSLQLELAEKTGLPVIIHDREAHGDCFETVLKHPGVRGVFHSYSGSAEMAREYIRLGWYLSFSGVVTFTNAAKTHEAAKATPLDRLLIETDAPYLAPVPMRGKMNHSGYIRYTAEKIAELHDVDIETVARITEENAKKLFAISADQ